VTTRLNRRAVMAWTAAGLYLALIWMVSSMGNDEVPAVGKLLYDKAVHCCEFMVLGFLLAHALLATFPGRPLLRIFLTASLAAIGWGVLDEMHQAFVPGRSAEAYDLVADAIGSVLGAGARVAARLRPWRSASPRSRSPS
jgi:VanZ family protein